MKQKVGGNALGMLGECLKPFQKVLRDSVRETGVPMYRVWWLPNPDLVTERSQAVLMYTKPGAAKAIVVEHWNKRQ